MLEESVPRSSNHLHAVVRLLGLEGPRGPRLLAGVDLKMLYKVHCNTRRSTGPAFKGAFTGTSAPYKLHDVG